MCVHINVCVCVCVCVCVRVCVIVRIHWLSVLACITMFPAGGQGDVHG